MGIILICVTVNRPTDSVNLPLAVLFGALIVFMTTFGVPVGGGWASLLPMTTVAAYLVMGLTPAAWTALAGALTHSWVRYRFANRLGVKRRPGRLERVSLAATNATIQSASILAGGAVFYALDGVTPLAGAGRADVIPLALLCLTHLGVNFMLAGLYIGARGWKPLQHYVYALPHLVFYEGGPLVFAPLMALTYTRLGAVQFTLFALAVVISSFTTHNLARSRERLERRVKELDSLQAVGQALSASLHIDVVLSAIFTQVSGLMSAHNFYVALYDRETGTVSFPLVVQDGQPVHWSSRHTGQGLTEYVLETRQPLLIRREFETALKKLGVRQIGRPAASWLGVPIIAGVEPLGVITVQSFLSTEAFDVSHQEVLVTIASQAAIAIQNAHLYAHTDQALARRVQELGSILVTTQEGILLLDLDWRVLTANRALSDLVGVTQPELTGETLHTPYLDSSHSFLTLIGYTAKDLQTDCQALAQGENISIKQDIFFPGSPERPIERALTPVREQEGAISGWLLVFRDLTEERELARMREELTHMLIHDLRSPLTVVKGAVDMLKISLEQGNVEAYDHLLTMAQRSSDRMLHMIGDLFEISKLESGQMPVHLQAVTTGLLLQEITDRLAPLATEAQITTNITVEPDLPALYVDFELIGRVLTNLVDNAIKFTPDGGHIQLRAWLDPTSDPPTTLISVSDTGPGIMSEEQDRLFEKFQVLTREGRRRGTGLGLPFCKLAVGAHGGQIWVESDLGQGSTFVVRLPVAESG